MRLERALEDLRETKNGCVMEDIIRREVPLSLFHRERTQGLMATSTCGPGPSKVTVILSLGIHSCSVATFVSWLEPGISWDCLIGRG